MDSVLLYHTECPACRKEGADRTGNNLAVYSDGHEYCYRCGYRVKANTIRQYKQKDVTPIKVVSLPSDVDTSIPQFAREWLEQYEFNNNTIINNKILWSQDHHYLIFPYFINGVLEGWQGRCFNPSEQEKRKWFSQGYLNEILYIIGKQSPYVVLTESIISAIKASRFGEAMPLWGSQISPNRWARLSRHTDKILLWLDPDKHKEAVKQANEGSLYINNVTPILTDRKPKDYSYQDIERIIYEAVNS
jgi:hypothetical protein